MNDNAKWDGHEFDPNGLAEYVTAVHEAIDRHMEFEDRWTAFARDARDVHGPLGELLRDIVAQHTGFRRDELRGHTTTGEGNRWSPVIEQAMAAMDFLRGVDL